MTSETKKNDAPPYIAFGTFISFIKGLHKSGIPSRIDKSLLRSMSGGNQSSLLAALRWFRLIDDVGTHGVRLERLVDAGDELGPVLHEYLSEAYLFMKDETIDLQRATGAQVEEKFRAYGLSGSTIVKAMAFFISACKEAGIPLSTHVKLPKISKGNGPGKKRSAALKAAVPPENEEEIEDEDGIPEDMPGFIKISVPLHGMPDGAVFLPDNMTSSQWAYALKITKFLIENYRPDEVGT